VRAALAAAEHRLAPITVVVVGAAMPAVGAGDAAVHRVAESVREPGEPRLPLGRREAGGEQDAEG